MTLFLSSVIGTFVGILPGIGSTVPAFMSYHLARARSDDPAGFGRGAPEGVAAAETANNAVTGGALVPMLALGIPGDAVTAVVPEPSRCMGWRWGRSSFGIRSSKSPPSLRHFCCARSPRSSLAACCCAWWAMLPALSHDICFPRSRSSAHSR